VRVFLSCVAELGGVWKHLSNVLLHASGFAPLCTSVEATAIALSLLLPLQSAIANSLRVSMRTPGHSALAPSHMPGVTLCASHDTGAPQLESEGGRERGVFLTIKNGLKVGKYNALSGDTASGRTSPAYAGEYYTPTFRLAMWHGLAGTRGLREGGREGGRARKRDNARVCARKIEDAREREFMKRSMANPTVYDTATSLLSGR
jgi:hypothetical protein